MASTNHTTNYSLSQFVGSDKPAWLGDYNQDMTKIDTQMKANADSVSTLGTTVSGHTTAISGLTSDVSTLQTSVAGNTSDISTLQTSVSTNTTNIATNASDIDTLETRCGTIETGLSNQGNAISSLQTDNATNQTNIAKNTGDIATLDTDLKGFERKFNLSNVTTITSISGYSNIMNDGINLTLAQNSDGSIFKMYGSAHAYQSSTVTASLTAVKGLSGYYGIKTTLQLTTPPKEAYLVKTSGIERKSYENNEKIGSDINFAVDEDGYIYICAGTSSTLQYQSYWAYRNVYFPCLYFNASFGDVPTPE